MRRYLLPGLCILVLVLALHTLTLASGVPGTLAVKPIEIVSAEGERHAFQAHLADTEETRGRGLMFVTRLEPDHGMLFDFGTTRPVGMWMKNTPLSLDMLFIDEQGVIVRIVERTVPFSTRIIRSRTPVRAVLELNAGRVEALGIETGDRLVAGGNGAAQNGD